MANQLKETTRCNSKLAITKYYQQRYNELKNKALKKNETLTVQSICVKYVNKINI